MHPSATPQSLALEERIGQLAPVQRSLLLWNVALEPWPTNTTYRPPPPRPSSDQSDAFVAKGNKHPQSGLRHVPAHRTINTVWVTGPLFMFGLRVGLR